MPISRLKSMNASLTQPTLLNHDAFISCSMQHEAHFRYFGRHTAPVKPLSHPSSENGK